MKIISKLIIIINLILVISVNVIACCGVNTKFKNFSNFYVLGDSLSDVGALTGAGSQFFQNIILTPKHNVELKTPYYQNRFWSNGPVAVDLVANKLNERSEAGWNFRGVNLKRYFRFGNNYAFGGALAEDLSYFSKDWKKVLFLNKFRLREQERALLNQHKIDNDDLIYINIGSNDLMKIIDENITNYESLIENLFDEIDSNLTNLIDNGSKHIVITNIADMGLIPNYKGTAKQSKMTELVKNYNKKLQQNINELNKDYHNNIIKEYDVFSEFNNIMKNFINRGAQYKLTNATTINVSTIATTGILQPQYVAGANPQNIDNYFFIDQFHPTKWVHEQFANDLYNFLLKLR